MCMCAYDVRKLCNTSLVDVCNINFTTENAVPTLVVVFCDLKLTHKMETSTAIFHLPVSIVWWILNASADILVNTLNSKPPPVDLNYISSGKRIVTNLSTEH